MSTANPRERGTALFSVLVVLALLLPLAAMAVLEVRTESQIAANERWQAEAFQVAEAGLAHALAETEANRWAAALGDGPNQRHGDADDGVFPFENPPIELFGGRAHYRVSVTSVRDELLRIVSTGLVAGRPGLATSAILRIEPTNSPAAIFIEGVAAFPVPASWVASTDSGGEGVIADPSGCKIAEVAERLTGHADRHQYSSTPPLGGLGSIEAPRLVVTDGEAAFRESVSGSGIVVFRTGLTIEKSFTYRGLVIVQGALTTAPTADVQIDGSLWIDATGGSDTRIEGRGAIRLRGAEFGKLADAFPKALPQSARFAGWQELF